MEGLEDGDADHPVTTLMMERLEFFVVMVFSWCTMLRQDKLLESVLPGRGAGA